MWEKAIPPWPDELELSVLGPGFGESILVHAGQGHWIAVDSCVSAEGDCAALKYLEAIGVSPLNVKQIIVTHWHNDHIRGMSELLARCEKAEFFCPTVFIEGDFLEFVAANSEKDISPLGASTSDLAQCFQVLLDRKQEPRFVGPDRVLSNIADPPLQVFSLSPNDARIRQFLQLIGQHRAQRGQTRRAVRDLHPNLVSVVVRIVFGNDAILLGADLQENPYGGWSTIIATSKVLSGPKATLFKVPHHGSENAHADAQWTDLLNNPASVLTPYNKGAHRLPTVADVQRIRKLSATAYSCARLSSVAPRKLDPSVARSLAEGKIKLRTADVKMGHVQFRRRDSDAPGAWVPTLFGNAVTLDQIFR